jgi:hypothetical protein
MRLGVATFMVLPPLLGVMHCASNRGSATADGGDHAQPGDGAPNTEASGNVGAADAGEASDTGPRETASDGGIRGADVGTMGMDGGSNQGTTLGSFVGVNVQITDSVANLAPIGVVREYHNWGWLGNNYNDQPYPQTTYTPNLPNFNWDWDAFFSNLRAMGVSGFPTVQGGVPWVNNSAVPPAQGSPTAAASYIAHGDAMFQIAARWGATRVADAKLELAPGQTRSTGLGTVEYFEDFNEEDNAPGFTGDVYAAMASADYDGDQMRLGTTIGVKNADPGAKLVMGGLSGAYGPGDAWINSITLFLDAARAWSTTNRGGSFPADVINVHYYSFGPGAPAPALSPEDDHVESKLAAVVAYRDRNLPGKPVWWTEFGYDTDGNSPLHCPSLGQNSAFIVQGQWLVRDLLAALAAGVERATVFELDDTCTPPEAACNTQFATSGLLAHPSSAPKPSWFFLATFRARLQTMVYSGERISGAADVKIFHFKDTKGSGGALVVWAPTSKAVVHSGYSLALPAGATSVKAVALADQQTNGVETVLTSVGGTVMLDVSETPTIVLYGP